MMEPIAAALAYLHDDPDKSRHVRVMVYDLGGGTFDITILDRRNGIFLPLMFDGDPELGGYNFDKALANHMLKHLRAQGYVLEVDPMRPNESDCWPVLMHYAERAKIQLSEPGQDGLKADVQKTDVFEDKNRKSVQLSITITREQFEKMVEPLVDRTIECCERALEKAKLASEKIDHFILIGGSSRLPIVQRKLREKYKRDLEINEQMVDLAVAIGAALYAESGGISVPGLRLEGIPRRTSAPMVMISGCVEPTETVADVNRSTVTVTRDDHREQQTTGDDDAFFFQVPLVQSSPNEIRVEAVSAAGEPIAELEAVVEHNPEEALRVRAEEEIGEIPTYLAKTIYVNTANKGLQPIVEEGPPLPLDLEVTNLVTGGQQEDADDQVRVELYQEDQRLTVIVLRGFSVPVPRGTPVKVTVHVGRDYMMSAKAEIPSIPGAVAEDPTIRTVQPPVPDPEELRAEAQRLRSEFAQFMQNFPPGNEKLKLGADGEKILKEVTEQLEQDAAPDLYRVQRLLVNLDRLIKQHSVDYFQPTLGEMQELFRSARHLVSQAEARDPSLAQHALGRTLDTLEQQAHAAYEHRDRGQWAGIAERVSQIAEQLERVASPPTGPQEPPPAPVIHAFLKQHIAELEAKAAASGRAGEPAVREALDAATRAVDDVNLSAPDAQQELIRIYQGPIQRVADLLKITDRGTGGGLPVWLDNV